MSSDRTRSLILRWIAAITLAGSVVVVVLAVAEAARVVGPPRSNLRVHDGRAEVFAVAKGDLLDRAGVERGDLILAVNGRHFSSGGELTRLFAELESGDRLRLLIQRDGRPRELSVVAAPNLDLRRLLLTGIPVLVLLLIGGAVFFAGAGDLPGLLFLLYCSTTAVNDVCQLPLLGGTSFSQLLLIASYTLFSIHSPALGLHLFTRFPLRTSVQRRLAYYLPVAYGVQLALGLSYFLPAYSSRWAALLDHPRLHALLLELFNANVIVCSVLGALSLAHMALRGDEEQARRQARLLFFGVLLLTMLQLALYTLPLRLAGRTLVSAEAYAMTDLVIPIVVAVAILFHRLFGIDVLVREGFVYGAASSLVAAAFALILVSLGWLAHRLWAEPNSVVVAIAAGMAVLLFRPSERRARQWVDRSLYRRRYSYGRLLQEINEQLSSVFDRQAVALLLHRRLEEALQPASIKLLLPGTQPGTMYYLGPLGEREEVATGAASIRELLENRHRPYVPASTDPTFAGISLLVPLYSGGAPVAAIALGPRPSGIPYLPEDEDFLHDLGRMAAPVLELATLLEERSERERLAMLGQATASVAHELKNPLAAIKSTAAILRRRLRSDPRGQELTHVVEHEIGRLESSLLQVLSFAKPRANRPRLVDLGELVDQLLSVLEEDFRAASVVFERSCDEGTNLILGDPDRLRQAVLNLLLNAREAMPQGGTIEIGLGPATTNPSGFGVRLTVADHGSGFSADALARATEPFFSSKRLGTGLGLANVRRTVEDHGGELEIRNRASGGAAVTVILPSSRAEGDHNE